MADTLENVVDVLGDPEDTRSWLGHYILSITVQLGCQMGHILLTIPGQVNTQEAGKAHQGVTHKGNTASLRCRTEEGNLGLGSTEFLGVREHRLPGCRTARVLVVLDSGEMGPEASIGLDDAAESDMEKGNQRWAEIPKFYVSL